MHCAPIPIFELSKGKRALKIRMMRAFEQCCKEVKSFEWGIPWSCYIVLSRNSLAHMLHKIYMCGGAGFL